jgi:hypothetical protein
MRPLQHKVNMNKVYTKSLIIIMAILTLLPLSFSYGQVPSQSEEITILMSPENPKAGGFVFLNVISNASDIKSAFITWSINGVVEKSGYGETNHRIAVGGIGKTTFVRVSVGRSGGTVSKSISIVPGGVALIWEADSYTPRFYKGKGLASHQSDIRVIAIPNLVSGGRKINKNNLSYEWSLDNKIDKSQSGTGKAVFNFKGSLISRPRTVSLLVKSDIVGVSARETVVINFVNPSLVFYKENPLTGIKSNNSLSLGFVEESESTFVVEPYFFSQKSLEKNLLDFRWIVDGTVLEHLSKSREIIFGREVIGRSSVLVEVSNPVSLLQSAKKDLRIIVPGE